MAKWTKLIGCLVAAATLTACSSDEGETSYDPTWGEDQLVVDGKADLLNVAQDLEIGDTVSGTVTTTSMDLYRIELTNGDKIRATMTRVDGDLSPDASMFTRIGTSVRSGVEQRSSLVAQAPEMHRRFHDAVP